MRGTEYTKVYRNRDAGIDSHYNVNNPRKENEPGFPPVYPTRMDEQIKKSGAKLPTLPSYSGDDYKKQYVALGLRIATYEKIIKKERAMLLFRSLIAKALLKGDYRLIRKLKALTRVVNIKHKVRESYDNIKTAKLLTALEISNFEAKALPPVIQPKDLEEVLKGVPEIQYVTEDKPNEKVSDHSDWFIRRSAPQPPTVAHTTYDPAHLRHDLDQWHQMKNANPTQTVPVDFDMGGSEQLNIFNPPQISPYFETSDRAHQIRNYDTGYTGRYNYSTGEMFNASSQLTGNPNINATLYHEPGTSRKTKTSRAILKSRLFTPAVIKKLRKEQEEKEEAPKTFEESIGQLGNLTKGYFSQEEHQGEGEGEMGEDDEEELF